MMFYRKIYFFISMLVFVYAILIGKNAYSQKQSLSFLNWPEYIDPELIKTFEKQNDVDVKEIHFETDETKEQMILETNGEGFDIVLSSGMPIARYIKQGWLDILSVKNIPNISHIDPRWREARPGIKSYAVPYTWGTTGIVYRKDFVTGKINSWLDLYQPSEELKGKIVMINDSKEVVGLALKALGHSFNSVDPTHYNDAANLLHKQRPFVFDYSYVTINENSSLVTGEIWMAMIYNGDGLVLETRHPEINFIVPKEGTSLWIDYLVVMKKSKKKQLAYKFIDFLNEPQNAAQLSEYLMFASPNKSAKKYLPEDHLKNPKIYPDQDILEISEVDDRLPPGIEKKLITIFTEASN